MLLVKSFQKYKRSNELFSIILIDIDFFKRINDEHGHETGDQVLIKFANILSQCTRDYDILARWGGRGVHRCYSPIRNSKMLLILLISIAKLFVKKNSWLTISPLRVSLTAGVANIQDYVSVDECIKRADNLLYEGKKLRQKTKYANAVTFFMHLRLIGTVVC